MVAIGSGLDMGSIMTGVGPNQKPEPPEPGRRPCSSPYYPQPAVDPIPEPEFEQLVGEALDTLPDELGRLLDNVVILVEDEHPEEDLLGLYEGLPLTEREYDDMMMPDRITIYRLPLCEESADLDELRREVTITVVHEVAHHFGIDDDALHELGWG
jgi:predicted Zn-dependent protease with MMP-like domain